MCDPVKGKARCLTNNEDYCLLAVAISDCAEVNFSANIRFTPDSKRIYMQIGWHGESHICSVPAAGGKLKFHTHGARTHTLGNLSADGKSLTFTMGNAAALDEVYVSRVNPRRVSALTDFNGPLMRELDLAKPQTSWVLADDDHKVQVWMMKPPQLAASANGHRAPAVLEIHGGPHAQYGVGYFHEFQVLCAAGYGVFFSNPRGSKGYGRDHCAAIRGDWGNKDWMDIQAVTEFMKAQSWVNPRKFGVMGGSYGGYMTSYALTHSQTFKIGIAGGTVSDWRDYDSIYTERYMQTPQNDPDGYWKSSPVHYAKDLHGKLLLIHGAIDDNVHMANTIQFLYELQKAGKQVQLMVYPKARHGVTDPMLVKHMRQMMTDFILGNL